MLKVKLTLGANVFEVDGDTTIDEALANLFTGWVVAQDVESGAGWRDVSLKVDQLLAQGAQTMSSIADVRAELAAANAVTNEIAADVAELVARAANATDPAEIEAALADAAVLTQKLRDVAAIHTSAPAEPPPPPSETE